MHSSSISSAEFMITSSRDESVQGFHAENRNVKYLPKNLAEKFPNLIIIYASKCSLKAITNENLKGLDMKT